MMHDAYCAQVHIREFLEGDWPQVWGIVREVVRARETFTYEPEITEEQARAIWIELRRERPLSRWTAI